MAEKLDLPFPLLSDPRGDLIKRCGLWNEEEGVSEPVIVALDGSATVRYLCSGGTNFADRPRGDPCSTASIGWWRRRVRRERAGDPDLC